MAVSICGPLGTCIAHTTNMHKLTKSDIAYKCFVGAGLILALLSGNVALVIAARCVAAFLAVNAAIDFMHTGRLF